MIQIDYLSVHYRIVHQDSILEYYFVFILLYSLVFFLHTRPKFLGSNIYK